MFTGTQRCFKTATPLFSQSAFLNSCERLSAHDGARHRQAMRHLSVSRTLTNKVHGHVKPKETVDIPGLKAVTYAERQHYVPGLAKPVFPPWERGYKDPRYYTSPPAHEMPLFKEKPCYVFNQRTSVLEGILSQPVTSPYRIFQLARIHVKSTKVAFFFLPNLPLIYGHTE